MTNHIIEEVLHVTEFCSPAHFVGKKGGEDVRLDTDFHAVNRRPSRPTKPFASSDQIKKELDTRAKVWACIDMVAGYYQIPLRE